MSNVAGLATSSNALLTVVALQPPDFDQITVTQGNQVRLILSGQPGNYVVLTSSNLVNWVAWTNVVIETNGQVELLDSSTASDPQRFYRAAPAP